MAKYNYLTAGDYSSPASSEIEVNNSNASVSDDTASNYLLTIRSLIDGRIEKRIKEGHDIAQTYTAEIVSKTLESIVIGNVFINETNYSVTADKLKSIRVRYNEDDYTDISNETVKILSENDKWIKICTYDGVNFYVIHTL